MKIFFLLNPSDPKRSSRYRQLAARAAQRYGWTPRFGVVDRQSPRSTEELLNQAWEEGCRRVGVIGGDGTLHRVVNVLRQQKKLDSMEIAVIPAGTCNDFARLLGLKKGRLKKAFRLACSGAPRATDLGLLEADTSEVFLNNAGVGRRTRSRTTPLKTLQSFKPQPLHIRWDRGSLEGSFFMALACNGPYFSGGLHVSKSPRLSDGLLDFYFVPAGPKWRLLPLLALGKLGRPVGSRRLISLRVSALEIQTDGDLWPQADGEPAGNAVRRVRFSLAVEKAMIVCPEGAPFWK